MRLKVSYSILICVFLSVLSWRCHQSDPPAVKATIPTDTAVFTPSTTYTGVCIGNSIIAGFPWRQSGLELGILDLPDTVNGSIGAGLHRRRIR
jgi:hypothetical protein